MAGCPNFPPRSYIRHFLLLNQQEFDSNILALTKYKFTCTRECVSTGTVGARTHRSLGHHLLHLLILRLLVLCAPAVLRPRALQDAPAPADPNS